MLKELEQFIILKPEDKSDYEKYSQIRGYQLYLFIFKYLSEKAETKIEYAYIRDLIKYDKRLKNNLYIYLGTFEDSLKSLIYEKTNYINKKFKSSAKIDGSSFKEINSQEKYDLNRLIKIFSGLNIKNECEIKDFNQIREFRNKVMHYNFLLLTYIDNGIQSRVKWLKENILILKNCLPIDYQNNFIKTINNCKNKLNLSKNYILEDL